MFIEWRAYGRSGRVCVCVCHVCVHTDEYIDDEFNALGTAAAAALLGGISASLDTAQLLETTTGLHADMDTGALLHAYT